MSLTHAVAEVRGSPSAEVAQVVVAGGEGAVPTVNTTDVWFRPLVGSRLWSFLISVPCHCMMANQ